MLTKIIKRKLSSQEDVFLGTTEKYNQKLEMLAKMAQPEKWTYK